MKCLQALFIFLVMAAAAYLLLRLYSRLFAVDMLAVLSWQIKHRQFGWMIAWGMFFSLSFIPLLGLLQKPFMLATMQISHEGGLLGYAVNDERSMLYDPVKQEYRPYRIFPAPRAARSFDETFENVSVYRPFLTSLYQNIEMQDLFVAGFMLFLVGIGFSLLSVLTYKLTEMAIQEQRLPQRLSLQGVLDNCRELTGHSLPVVLTAAVLFLVIASLLSAYLANRIKKGDEERFAIYRQDLRSEIMATVAPRMLLKGRVVNRMRNAQSYSSGNSPQGYRHITTVKTSIYTIEFRKVVKYQPVYLRLTLSGDAAATPEIKRLDELFPPDDALPSDEMFARMMPVDARDTRELDFVVNDDLSVSLAPGKQ